MLVERLLLLFHQQEVVLKILHFLRFKYLFKDLQTWQSATDDSFSSWDLQKDWEVIWPFDQNADDIDLVLNIALLDHLFNFLRLYTTYNFLTIIILSFKLFLYLSSINFRIVFLEHRSEYLGPSIDHLLVTYPYLLIKRCLLLPSIELVRPYCVQSKPLKGRLELLRQDVFNLIHLLVVLLLKHNANALEVLDDPVDVLD